MPYGLYMSAEGASAQIERVNVIANNLANVDTVGFKRDLAVLQSRYAEAISKGLVPAGQGELEDQGGGVMVRETKIDFSGGPLKHTENVADLAIAGDGFFQVKKGDDTFLTRAGNFSVNSRNELVTQQGYSVLNEAGQPIMISPDAGSWHFDDQGQVVQPGLVQKLAIVKPDSLTELSKHGENLFRAAKDVTGVADAERRTAPGYLEASAVKPTVEMTSLIEATRVLEANTNMMKTQDQMLGSLISRVLKV